MQYLHDVLLFLTGRETLSGDRVEQAGQELGRDLLNSFRLEQSLDPDRPVTADRVERFINAAGSALFGCPARIVEGTVCIDRCIWSNPGVLPANFCFLIKSCLRTAAELSIDRRLVQLKIETCSNCYRISCAQVEATSQPVAVAGDKAAFSNDNSTRENNGFSGTLHNLAAEAAHETRNCLATINGVIDLLQLKKPAPSSSLRYYGIISSEINRASHLLQDLINLSRPVVLRQEMVDINVLLEETLLLVGKNLFDEEINILRDFDGNLPKVLVDPYQIKQIFLNIIQNSIQALLRGGMITIRTFSVIKEKRWVVISFMDTGKGISPEHLPFIFTPFYTTKPGGTGLGLAICQRILDGLGGTLEVKSKENHGTTVNIKLPSGENCRDV